MAISFIGSAVNSSSPNTGTSVDVSGIDIQANDLILVAAAVGDTANNGMAAPTEGGYSRVPGVAATQYANDVNDTNLDLYYKVASGSETAVSFAAVGGTNASNAAVVMVFRGVDASTPFDTDATPTTGVSSSNADPPSHDWSGASGGWTVIAASTGHTGGATATFTFPTGYTTNPAQRAHNDTIDVLVGMGYNASPADPENPGALTAANIGTAADNGWAAVTMSLKLAVVNHNLTADSGSYSLTGTAVDPELGRLVSADGGSYTLSGTAVALTVGHPLNAESGSYSATGTDATLEHDAVLAAGAGSYDVTGTDASLELGRVIAADAGAYVVTGQDATLTHGSVTHYALTADAGEYAVIGSAVGLVVGSVAQPLKSSRPHKRRLLLLPDPALKIPLPRVIHLKAGAGHYGIQGGQVEMAHNDDATDDILMELLAELVS